MLTAPHPARPRSSAPRSAAAALVALLLPFLVAVVVPPTSAYAADTRRPVVGTVFVSPTQDRATVTWTTDEKATGQAVWGTTTAYGRTSARATSLTTTHSQTLTGLTPGTTYYLQVRSTDASGNTGVSADRTFTTARASTFTPGNTSGTVAVPSGMGLEDVSHPDRVVGTGTAASCTSAAVLAAASAGGVVTFRCGASPVTITLSQTIKVRNSTARLVLDGGGLVTLSGGGTRRILYTDTCDTSLGTVSGNCLYAPQGPRVTVQNLTFADGNATSATYVSPGDSGQGSNGGGAIFQLGGRLKVVRSVFVRNTCASNGPDLGGGAIRVLAQHSATPNDLDASYAARGQDPVAIVQSTFGGASGRGNRCSNGGAISGLRTPITVINSLVTDNSAVGCCANPAHAGTPGGGSGGAIYTDGTSYDLKVLGTRIERNSAKAGGSAIFFVSNDRTGHLAVQSSVSRNNTYAASGYSPSDQHFETYPGIFYRGSGDPSFTGSTIQ
ncbi:fibronectin type III domain-containing protein [Microlunatus antarcticus]